MINRLMKSLEPVQRCVNRLYPSLSLETPSPVSPSPWQGEGDLIERGAPPLLYTRLRGGGLLTPDYGREGHTINGKFKKG